MQCECCFESRLCSYSYSYSYSCAYPYSYSVDVLRLNTPDPLWSARQLSSCFIFPITLTPLCITLHMANVTSHPRLDTLVRLRACMPGEELVSDVCTACKPGSRSNSTNQDNCDPCQPGACDVTSERSFMCRCYVVSHVWSMLCHSYMHHDVLDQVNIKMWLDNQHVVHALGAHSHHRRDNRHVKRVMQVTRHAMCDTRGWHCSHGSACVDVLHLTYFMHVSTLRLLCSYRCFHMYGM